VSSEAGLPRRTVLTAALGAASLAGTFAASAPARAAERSRDTSKVGALPQPHGRPQRRGVRGRRKLRRGQHDCSSVTVLGLTLT
jgi:hypothetical protein